MLSIGMYTTVPVRSCQQKITIQAGHPQREHESSHGSISKPKWSVEGSKDAALEVNGHKFATYDDGLPMMCNLYCTDLGRHVHLDYCRSENPASCSGAEIQHLSTRMRPNPEKPKDLITHSLHWKRMGTSFGPSLSLFSLKSLQDSKACLCSGSFRATNEVCRSILQERSGRVC